jgi:hypothetical protein
MTRAVGFRGHVEELARTSVHMRFTPCFSLFLSVLSFGRPLEAPDVGWNLGVCRVEASQVSAVDLGRSLRGRALAMVRPHLRPRNDVRIAVEERMISGIACEAT